VFGEGLRVVGAGDDGSDDTHPSFSSDVTDDVMNLNVHQCQCFVHVLHVRIRSTHEHLAMSHVAAKFDDLRSGSKARSEQTKGMQLLQPLAVEHIAFTTRHVSDMLGVDEQDLEVPLFQDLVEWNPVNSGGFHGDRADAALGQPVCQRM
jgi:hypothetical protein